MVRLLNNFTRVCRTTENGEELCSCDFRLNIYECQNSEFYVITGKILSVLCILLVIIATGFLIYLTRFKKQPFFLPASRERGWIRPRPLHSYHLMVVTYMFFEAFHLIALITESYPSITAAELGNITANVATASVAIFYTVSIVYSTPNVKFNESFELLSKNSPNTLFVDIVGVTLFILPIVAWFPLANLTGKYAESNDIEKANYYFAAHYFAFVVWEVIYVLVLAYFWYKLMAVIKSYIKVIEERQTSSGSTITNNNQLDIIKKCSRNVTLPVMGIVGGLLSQAVIYVIMSSTYRTNTIYYFGWNVFYYWIEYLSFPLIALSIESFLLYYFLILKHEISSAR